MRLFTLIHCILLKYVPTRLTYLDRLVELNNELLRILQNKSVKYFTDKLYYASNILTVSKLHDFQLIFLSVKLFITQKNYLKFSIIIAFIVTKQDQRIIYSFQQILVFAVIKLRVCGLTCQQNVHV